MGREHEQPGHSSRFSKINLDAADFPSRLEECTDTTLHREDLVSGAGNLPPALWSFRLEASEKKSPVFGSTAAAEKPHETAPVFKDAPAVPTPAVRPPPVTQDAPHSSDHSALVEK